MFLMASRPLAPGMDMSISTTSGAWALKIPSPIREEIVTVRGIVPGEYTVNISHFQATTGRPVAVNVKVQKLNPTAQVRARSPPAVRRVVGPPILGMAGAACSQPPGSTSRPA